LGSLGTTNQQQIIKDVRFSFMKEVNIVARTLSIGNGKGGALTPLVIVVNNCRTVVWLELGYTIGIDHQ
jgi:hypothetical protein